MSVYMNRKKQTAQVAERLMFLPTGEVFKDERNSSYYHSDFLFSGKELDAETGNYYYGARYYAPRIGIWLSPDPLQLKYPHISSYAYCAGNPVKFIDDFGEKIVLAGNHQQRMTVLTYMQKLTNDKLGVGKDGTVYILEKGVRNTNRSLAIGTNLIADIINNKRTMTITNNRKEVNFEKDKVDVFSYNGIGTDVKVNFNDLLDPLIPTRDTKTLMVSDKKRPKEIGLGHELIHGIRSMEGKAVDNSIEGKYSYKTTTGSKTQIKRLEELETVGLKGRFRYTENMLRKEQGIEQRGAY